MISSPTLRDERRISKINPFFNTLLDDLESTGLLDELVEPLHVGRSTSSAGIVSPAIDIFLGPTVMHRAEARHRFKHSIVRLLVREASDARHRFDGLDQLAMFGGHIIPHIGEVISEH